VNLLAQIVAHKRDFILHRQSNCGINYFTYAAKISLQLIGALSSPVRGEACHEASKLHQVRYREQRSFLPHGDFRIRLAHIGPLRGNGAEALVVDAQQETLAGAVIALANADELPATEWMEGMSYADKLRRGINKACIPSYVTNGLRLTVLSGHADSRR
jgi:hypothetical protein